MSKTTSVIAIELISHDGEDVAAGETIEGLSEKQADALVDRHVAVPNTAEGKKFAKAILAAPSSEVVTDDEAPTAEVANPAGKSSKR